MFHRRVFCFCGRRDDGCAQVRRYFGGGCGRDRAPGGDCRRPARGEDGRGLGPGRRHRRPPRDRARRAGRSRPGARVARRAVRRHHDVAAAIGAAAPPPRFRYRRLRPHRRQEHRATRSPLAGRPTFAEATAGRPAVVDRLLAVGELWSSRIVAACLADAGIASQWCDARSVIRTDARHGCAAPDLATTAECVARLVRPALALNRVVVIGGFVGSGPGRRDDDAWTGRVGLFGRDPRRLPEADEIEIWTDVDGVLVRRSARRGGRAGAPGALVRGRLRTGQVRREGAAPEDDRAGGGAGHSGRGAQLAAARRAGDAHRRAWRRRRAGRGRRLAGRRQPGPYRAPAVRGRARSPRWRSRRSPTPGSAWSSASSRTIGSRSWSTRRSISTAFAPAWRSLPTCGFAPGSPRYAPSAIA